MKYTDLDLKNETQVIAWLKKNYPIGTEIISPKTGNHTFIYSTSEFRKSTIYDNSYMVNNVFIIYKSKLIETLPLCDLEPQHLENNYEIY